jgi:hypothetical protein
MKYILAGLWLLCYFPFLNSFVADQEQTAVLYLENLQSFDDECSYEQWKSCLSFLEKHGIVCCIRIKCQDRNFDDHHFTTWLNRLEEKGHCIVHSKNCTCGSFQRTDLTGSKSSELANKPLAKSNPSEDSLLISLPTDYFRNQFSLQVKKSDLLLVLGDPSLWNWKQFEYFQDNIEYLMQVGIKFNRPQKI